MWPGAANHRIQFPKQTSDLPHPQKNINEMLQPDNHVHIASRTLRLSAETISYRMIRLLECCFGSKLAVSQDRDPPIYSMLFLNAGRPTKAIATGDLTYQVAGISSHGDKGGTTWSPQTGTPNYRGCYRPKSRNYSNVDARAVANMVLRYLPPSEFTWPLISIQIWSTSSPLRCV